jgi:hypothetical protein
MNVYTRKQGRLRSQHKLLHDGASREGPSNVGSWLRAEASVVWLGMLVQIIQDHVVGDIAAGGREIASLPEPLSPVAFADMLELLLYLA